MSNRRNTIYILAILSFVVGLLTGRAFYFNLGYMFCALLLFSMLWAWASVRWLVITRRTRSRRAQVGRLFEEQFIIHNPAILPKLWLEVRDESNLPGHVASHIVPALGVRSKYSWQVKTRCATRGEFKLGPMTISSGDPFGLFHAMRRIDATTRVIVYPQIVEIQQLELPIGNISGGEAQRRRSHYVTTNAAGVRDYVPGDSFNRIHWRSTARRDKLIVKEFEIDPLVDIWLFADFSALSLVEAANIKRVGGTGPIMPVSNEIPQSTEEYVAVVSASLAKYFITLDRALGFAAYTPNREIHQPERGNRQLTRILESLAVARSLSDYTLGQMLTLETPYFTRGTTLLIVTASLEPSWVIEAQILTRRGIRPMCILIDASTFGGIKPSDEIRGILQMANIPTVVIRYGDDIATALAQRSL
ncbi:MAG: DUF58 domain-containing protein [Phototrophicales bacterium]